MPVVAKESGGQVLRGFCPTCEQVTKRKDAFGSWVSRCAHPGKNYQGRMTPGGKKSIPVIPDTLDRGQLPGAVEQALEARSDVDGYAEQIERKPVGGLGECPKCSVSLVVISDRLGGGVGCQVSECGWRSPVAPDRVQGMIDPNELRDEERRLRSGQYASGVPADQPSAHMTDAKPVGWQPGLDPLDFDAPGALQQIANHARGIVHALIAAQKRVFELETQIADQAVELVKAQRDVIELELRNADLENDVDRLEGEVIELGGSVVTAEPAEKKEFDPLDVQF